MATQAVKSDAMDLRIECSYSNIGEEWVAEAITIEYELDGHAARSVTAAFGKGQTRPDALRELADALEQWGRR